MNALEQLLPALGWSLIHFLWEGALLGLLAWGSLRLTRRWRPELRHGLACSFLALMIAVFFGTLAWSNFHPSGEGAMVELGGMVAQAITGKNGEGVSALLQANLTRIVGLWFIGAFLMSIRLGGGWFYLHSVCLRGSSPADRGWETRLQALCPDLIERRRPRLRLSTQIDSLMVIRWIKPVILIPAAAMANLDPVALEAILAHELAHVRRQDYLINLLQNMAEAMLFFHPAVWWVSRQIRLECENCCDDAAIQSCGDPVLYASALAALEALRIPTLNTMHLAPQARGGSLMLRIRRILTSETPSPTGASLITLLSTSALALALFMGAFTSVLRAAVAVDKPTASASESKVVDVPFKKVKVAYQPPPPAYPADAKANRIQGTVKVEIIIGVDGKPAACVALSGPKELRATAIEYASQWRFEPAIVKGKPVKARFVLNMPFKLQ